MAQKKSLNQSEINRVWSDEWKKELHSPKTLFAQRLFVEGYPVFKKYIPIGAQTILEVGAGSGRYGLALARDLAGTHVTLTDIVDESLVRMRHVASELGLTNVAIQKEDAFALSFPDDSFDVVFSDAVIQHIPQHQNAVKEMIRVLKPGGTLILSSVNRWNIPHVSYKKALSLIGKEYPYGFERTFSASQLKTLMRRYHMQNITTDGFYFAYGVYRWKAHHPIFKKIGGIVNRTTRVIDAVSGRAFSKYFGFEVFSVAQKPKLHVKYSGLFMLPTVEDKARGDLMMAEGEKSIPFAIKRIYLIKGIPEFNAVRGSHAHKKLDQVIFCINGSFELNVEDGESQQQFVMKPTGFGVRLGPKLWHTMTKFSKDCIILVVASDYLNEADYLRNYDEWKEYLKNHPD